MKRKQLSRKKSEKLFRKTAGANKVKSRNFKTSPMRGGYRL
jgi:hypothetical protein